MTKITEFKQDLTVIDAFHPTTDGLTDSNLDNWTNSAHGYFDLIPADSKAIVGVAGDPRGKPTYIEYTSGEGTVVATMQPLEWPWSDELESPDTKVSKDLLRNEIQYALGPSRTIDTRLPVNASAIPLAATDRDAFFELRFSPTDEFGNVATVGPLIFRTNRGIDLVEIAPLVRYDPLQDAVLSIALGVAESVTSPPTILASISLNIATDLLGIIEKVNRQHAEDTNYAEFGVGNAPETEARFLIWVRTAPNKSIFGDTDNVRAYYTYSEITGESETTVDLLPPVIPRPGTK